MDDNQFLITIKDLTDKIQMALTVLYSTVERSGTQVEGFNSLRQINEAGYAISAGLIDGSLTLETSLELYADLLQCIQVETARLDTESNIRRLRELPGLRSQADVMASYAKFFGQQQ